MENIMQMSAEEYCELLKSKNDYEDKKNEYEQRIEKQSLIRTEYVSSRMINGISTPFVKYSYIGKEDAIAEIIKDVDKYRIECEQLKVKNSELERKLLKKHTLLERLKFLFTGKLYNNESE